MARTIKQLPVNAARFDESTGYLRIVASTETPDRDDEVVVPSTIRLDTYQRNPVVLWAHDQEKLPIGKSRCELDGDGNLIAEFHFADTDEGKAVESLYRQGILRGASIGFVSDGTETVPAHEAERLYGVRKKLQRHTGGELVEISAIGVPSNPNALAIGWVNKSAARQAISDKSLPRFVRKGLQSLIPMTQATNGRKIPRTSEGRTVAQTTQKALDDAMAPAPVDAAGGPTHQEAIANGLAAGLHALVDDFAAGHVAMPELIQKIKSVAKMHGEFSGDPADAAPVDEVVEGEEDLTTMGMDGDDDDMEYKGDLTIQHDDDDDAEKGMDEDELEDKADCEDDLETKGDDADEDDETFLKSLTNETARLVIKRLNKDVGNVASRLAKIEKTLSGLATKAELEAVVETLGEVVG